MIDKNTPPGAGHTASPMPSPMPEPHLFGPTPQFLAVGVVGLIGASALSGLLTGGTAAVAAGIGGAFFAVVMSVAAIAVHNGYPHRRVGLCNTVTILRLALVSALVAALLTAGGAPWPVFLVATLAFVMDGADGWLARRAGLVSDFGARFDMEVDSILALALALLAYRGGDVGALVLLLGVPRYLFFFAQIPLPWLAGDLPERFSRKVVCVVQIAALLCVLMPVVTAPLSSLIVGAAVLAVIWSFVLDIRLLWRARP